MSDKNTAVFGIFRDRIHAESGVDALLRAGFASSAVAVLMADSATSREFAHEKHTKAPDDTATGAAVGGAIGGTLGLLAGIGALAIPGLGPFIAAGPIMASLAGAGGAVGSFIGALSGLGLPEFEAKRYEGLVKNGGTLLSVHCATSEDVSRAKDVLKAAGGNDVSSASEAKGESASAYTTRY